MEITQSTFPTVKSLYVLIPDKYALAIEDGQTLTLVMGFTHDKAGARFEHPNISKSRGKKFEFKHYGQNGSKWWTSEQGVDHYLVVPRDQIRIVREMDYDYPRIVINNETVRLNVSGGSGGRGFPGWVSWIYGEAETCINHSLETLKAVCEVAIKTELPDEPKEN
jgi:hypothetical protein